jgi:hypothetical protein
MEEQIYNALNGGEERVNSADWNHSKNGASSKLGQFHLQRGLGERTSQKKL